MNTLRPAVFFVLVSCLASAAAAQGVQTGVLRGIVVDGQELPVPGVAVTIASPAMQGSRTATSGADGGFVFRLLPAGDYEVQLDIQGFTPERRSTTIPLGQTAELHVMLRPGTVSERVIVEATAQPLANVTVGLNIRQREVEALATSRSLRGIATLSPGVNDYTPDLGTNKVSISGAPSFDNLFMVNGVDVNDNITGAPQDLFIEEAIAETQVLTSGLPAEFGRFSGGVVNAITRSGGNLLSGSFRVNLTNPAWTKETPFERDNDIERDSITNAMYEGTVGGPLVHDRAWFFAAGRRQNRTITRTLDVSALPYTSMDESIRVEGKITATVRPAHTVQGGFLTNPRDERNRPAFPDAIDPATLTSQKTPNWYVFGNYRGAINERVLLEAQYSERRWRSEWAEGVSTAINDSPIFSLSEPFGFYNGPYFDPADPEERNNRQFTGNVTRVIDRAGRHEVKGGYEWFRSQNTGGNSQSASGFVFDTAYVTDDDGNPVFGDDGRLIPVFLPADLAGEDETPTLLETWTATPGAVLNVDTNSLYVQDHWQINRFVSADLGLRYERVRSEATGNIVGVDTSALVPRLAVSVDPTTSGRFTIRSTYGHYAGRYNENLIGRNANVGNPDQTIGVYLGPAGEGRDFLPGFDPANYLTFSGFFPTANVMFEEDLSAPLTREFTVSGGASAGSRAHVDVSYVWRQTTDLIEDFIALDNGETEVVRDETSLGVFTNRVYRNSDIPERAYQALIFQGRYAPLSRLTFNGSWTVQLKNDGNYEGEGLGDPAIPSVIGDYPEVLSEARHFPTGRLAAFQRHRARVWSIYDHSLGTRGDVTVSGLWRFESGRPYSLVALDQPLSDTQLDLLADYADSPAGQPLFFDERGSETFPSHALFDVSLNYSLPLYGRVRPWVKFDIFNLFDNDTLIAFDTTVRPDPSSPVDALGLRTGYLQGTNFGEARSANDYPRSLNEAGGRAFRVAFGVRF
jgi:hypothetical protein